MESEQPNLVDVNPSLSVISIPALERNTVDCRFFVLLQYQPPHLLAFYFFSGMENRPKSNAMYASMLAILPSLYGIPDLVKLHLTLHEFQDLIMLLLHVLLARAV